MNLQNQLISILLVCMLGGCNPRQAISIEPSQNSAVYKNYSALSQALSNELMKEYNAGTFEGTILIVSKDKILHKQSYGWANRKNKIKNNMDSISDMGSIAKTFTAAAILQLISRGELRLEDTIAHFYPDAPPNKKNLTIKQLLSHSSGLDNFHSESDFEEMTKQQAIYRILSLPIIGKPDETVAYSNAAYTLLAAIIEKNTGQSFQKYVHQKLLEPLSLLSTGFYGDSDIPEALLSHGYGGDNDGETTNEKGLTWALVGQGGMVTSTEDLYKWFQALQKGSIFSNNQNNLSFVTANKKWKLGNIRYFNDWGPLIFHLGGSTDFGYTALVQYIPKYDTTIVMLLNTYSDKYAQATHHKLSQHHIVPILINGADALE